MRRAAHFRTVVCRGCLEISIGRQRVGAFKNAFVESMPLKHSYEVKSSAGTACESECVLTTLVCRGLRVGPSKNT